MVLTTTDLTSETPCQNTSTFKSTTSVSTASMQTAAEVLADFYDQSFALHEDLSSSPLSELSQSTSTLSDTQWNGTISQGTPSAPVERVPTSVPFPISFQQITDMRALPSAVYLRSIEPQTMTVNLIIGIMTLSPTRLVTVGRRWGQGREMQLLELLVGDDTKAGFEITIWLSNGSRTDEGNALKFQMQRLRPRDVILLRNVALRAYQGRVHGQSLRRDVTKAHLVHRRKLDDSDPEGMYSTKALLDSDGTDPIVKKVRRVSQWLMDFVGDDMPDTLRDGPVTRRAVLPPDTQ